jgi:hypothetical protein
MIFGNIFAILNNVTFTQKCDFMNTRYYADSGSIQIGFINNLVKNGEYLLLCFVAIIGLSGSIFVLSQKKGLSKNELSQFAPAIVLDEKKSDFDKYVSISGNKKAGEALHFEIKNLEIISPSQGSKRYVMEMGDGSRMIITQSSFDYKYASKGEYKLELKEIQRGLLILIGEKKLKIKE